MPILSGTLTKGRDNRWKSRYACRLTTEIQRNRGRQASKPVRLITCAPSLVQFTVSEPDLEEIMAALRCFDSIQMQLPCKGGCSPDYCASSQSRSLKQLGPGLAERSPAARYKRLRGPVALLLPLSSSTHFHPQASWDATMQGKRPSALSSCAALCAPAQHD